MGNPPDHWAPPVRAHSLSAETWPNVLAAARSGCSEARGLLLDALRPPLLVAAASALSRDLQPKAEAADLVQESLVEGYRDFGAFRGRSVGEMLAWLRQILAHNVSNFRRHFRSTGRRSVGLEVPLSSLGDGRDPARRCHPADPSGCPVDLASKRELADRLNRAVATLPAETRAVILRRHHDGLSFGEIGTRLGRTSEGARQVWWRGVSRLRYLLGQVYYRD